MVRLASSGVTSPCRAVIFFWLQKTQSLGQPLWDMKIGIIACFFNLQYLLDDGAYVGQGFALKIHKAKSAFADKVIYSFKIRVS